MKCFSITTKIIIVPSSTVGIAPIARAAWVVKDEYPTPSEGIVIRPSDHKLVIGFREAITAADELVGSGAPAMHQDGSGLRVMRCSLDRHAETGAHSLVPERADDTVDALVYLDLGAGRHLNLSYELASEQVVSRVRINSGLTGYDEQVLVRLKPGETLTALRSDRRFFLFGAETVREKLVITYDGEKVTYERKETCGC